MSKHTPGPWKINAPITAPTFPALDVRDDKGWLLAQVQSAPDMTLHTTAFNASLIAAAPELLEALKRAHSRLTAFPQHFDSYDADMDEIERAIDKAEGK